MRNTASDLISTTRSMLVVNQRATATTVTVNRHLSPSLAIRVTLLSTPKTKLSVMATKIAFPTFRIHPMCNNAMGMKTIASLTSKQTGWYSEGKRPGCDVDVV